MLRTFVNEATHQGGQTLCVIEAMKLMNEIDAKARRPHRQVLVDNAQPVQFGQALFLLEPLK